MKLVENRRIVAWLVIIGGALALAPTLWAGGPTPLHPKVIYTPTTVTWQVPVEQYDRATLVIQGPGSFRIERTFE